MSKHLPTSPLNLEELTSNITFGELQKMSFEECSDFIDNMRIELLKIWDEGRPPYVGLSEDDIIEKFKQLENYDTSDFFVKDELYKDYVGFIRNFSKMGTGVNQFFPSLLKSKVNGYSIYDYLSNEELFRDFKYTIVQKVRFDKMYSYTDYLTIDDLKSRFEIKESKRFLRSASRWDFNEQGTINLLSWSSIVETKEVVFKEFRGRTSFWFEDYDFNKKNEELGRVKVSRDYIEQKFRAIPQKMSNQRFEELIDEYNLDVDFDGDRKSLLKELDKLFNTSPTYLDKLENYYKNRKGFNPKCDEKYFAVRMYKEDTPLFPKIFQVLRLGLGQVATNFPSMTAKWIYENYIKDIYNDEQLISLSRNKEDKPKVFDSSSGWGGRLLGALSSKVPLHYIGLDVNNSIKGCYETLGDFYNSKCGKKETFWTNVSKQYDIYDYKRDTPSNTNTSMGKEYYPIIYPNTFEIHYKGSEVIGDDDEFMSKHKGDVDLCFTSPPYFNKEIYSDDKEQSAIKFPNYEDWLSGFLEPTIKTYFDLLKENRYCLINIADLKIGENQFHPLEQDTIQLAIKCGFEYHRKYGMVMTRTIGTNPSDMRNSWLDVKSQKTYKVENILIFRKPIQPPPPFKAPKDIKLF